MPFSTDRSAGRDVDNVCRQRGVERVDASIANNVICIDVRNGTVVLERQDEPCVV